MNGLEKLLETWNNGVLRGARAKLSKEINVSEVTVSRWAKGELKPGREAIKKMSKLLGVSVEELENAFGFENKNDHNTVEGRIELEYIPVRGISSATEEKFILEETETYLPFRKTGPNQFAIKITGNCMVDPDDPRNSIYDGDYVIVDPDAETRNGDVIVARLDGEYSTVKRLYKHQNEVRLIPDNPACEPIIRTAATFIVGKVIDVYRPVRSKKERKI
ncbi:MAG: S24 family peptidase [Candidatus Avelusimicrobium sp.]|uniref:S24 family peptidase n=1 Tax=Candidatus Avelusimicrobium sp. TaxID=3048833 RepID=UPI003F0F9369